MGLSKKLQSLTGLFKGKEKAGAANGPDAKDRSLKIAALAGGTLTGIILLAVLGPKAWKYAQHKGRDIWHIYGHAFESVHHKVEELRRAEEENERLRLENANLRLRAESLQFDCNVKEAGNHTRRMELRLSKEAGSEVGLTLASIHYRPPVHLLPNQLYTLGVSYFKGREEEKAAVIFSLLTGLEENDAYKTPKNYLIAGISWYRVGNYVLADNYFSRILEDKDDLEYQPIKAQARLWRALIAKQTKNDSKVQHWLTELLDYHPHSTEADWINPFKELGRMPASTAKWEKKNHVKGKPEHKPEVSPEHAEGVVSHEKPAHRAAESYQSHKSHEEKVPRQEHDSSGHHGSGHD